MTESRDQKFVKMKGTVEEFLELLLVRADDYNEQGMLDENAHVHNELVTLQEEMSEVHSMDQLEEVVSQAKRIEHNLNTWAAYHGATTSDFDWPKFSI